MGQENESRQGNNPKFIPATLFGMSGMTNKSKEKPQVLPIVHLQGGDFLTIFSMCSDFLIHTSLMFIHAHIQCHFLLEASLNPLPHII